MFREKKTVAISSLARYAGDPASLLRKANKHASEYGNRAHNSLGRRRTGGLIIFAIAIAAAVAVFLALGGLR